MLYRFNWLLVCLLIFPVIAYSATASNSSFKAEILKREAAFNQNNSISVQDKKLFAASYIFKLYKLADYQPLWDEKNARSLITAIENIKNDGLTPKDYLHAELLSSTHALKEGQLSNTARLDIDLLFSEAYLRAVYNLLVGKVDPESLDSAFNFSLQLDGDGEDLPMLLQKIQSGQIEQAFDWARPQHRRYRLLKDGLAKYRAIQADGGWQPIDNGKTLKPGDSDPRVAQLRKRLSVTGDHNSPVDDSPVYDE
ncbi:MAG: hypothetical protein EP297_14705 [Gammaproteobacteria bacterium]|nr:MAG: hypothetical protein EP297_14705 [Gammaproteobacteria bacterium]